MKYKVKATRTVDIRMEIEADDPEQAGEIATNELYAGNSENIVDSDIYEEIDGIWTICPNCEDTYDPHYYTGVGICPDCFEVEKKNKAKEKELANG